MLVAVTVVERTVTGEVTGGVHPLAPVLPLLRDVLVDIAVQARHPMVVTDAEGGVLWCLERTVAGPHGWTCAACPVRDPDTGVVIGAVDVAGPARRCHPTTFALVASAAQLAEGHLAAQVALRHGRLVARHLGRLSGRPAALLSPGGRVLAAQPRGWLPARITLPGTGDRVPLGEAGEGVLERLPGGWLLRLL